MATVEAEGLSFSYRGKHVLENVCFKLSNGVTGLLGENGAGKTTLLRLIRGELTPTVGEIRITGCGEHDASVSMGYLPQSFEVMGASTVHRNVAYAAWANGVSKDRCDEAANCAIEQVGLQKQASQKARQLSGGMRQRLGIACSIAHRPEIVLMDEPTVGLDPLQRTEIRSLMHSIGRNACVVTSTHLIEDLTATASRVLVLHDKRVRFYGPIDRLGDMGRSHPQVGMSDYEAGFVACTQSAPE